MLQRSGLRLYGHADQPAGLLERVLGYFDEEESWSGLDIPCSIGETMSLQDFRDGTVFRSRARRGSRPSYGWWNLALALGYGLWEPAYFGWSAFPKSGAEMACDGIALLLIIITSNRIADTSAAAQEQK